MKPSYSFFIPSYIIVSLTLAQFNIDETEAFAHFNITESEALAQFNIAVVECLAEFNTFSRAGKSHWPSSIAAD